MHVMILGGAGMLGRKLKERLLVSGLGGREVDAVTLVDLPFPGLLPEAEARASYIWTDISEPGRAETLLTSRPDVIFHLAAIVSGEAEADFEKGYAVNLDGTRALLEAIRRENAASGYRPRLVFTSSVAVFGTPFPERIGDDFCLAPLTSYGTQKAIGELLLGDYSRRGFLDGVGVRLPTICIRPGKPNKAASGFFSNILREPLVGQEAVLPVSTDVRHWFASPRAAIGYLVHAAALDTARLGTRRSLMMPGVSATVGDQIEALRRIAGEEAVRLIRHEPDPVITRIIEGWPRDFDTARARELGFVAERSMEEIVQAHVEDELGGRIGAVASVPAS